MSGKHNKKFARSASGFHQPSMLLGLEDSICNTFPQICVKETKLNRHLHFSPVFPGHIGARMERLFVLEISSLDWMSLSSFPKYFLCPITLSHCRLKLLQASLLPMSCQILVTISTGWSYVVAQFPMTVIFYKSSFLTQHSVLKRILHLEKGLTEFYCSFYQCWDSPNIILPICPPTEYL